MPHPPVYYSDYLQLQKLLDSQHPLSTQHDEMLFIITHQAYELWLKQLVHELRYCTSILNQEWVPEDQLFSLSQKLERVKLIQKVLIDQIDILESMTPMDFLEFRDRLLPASGFQSVQFREVEILLGLSTDQRQSVDRHYFLGRLNVRDKEYLMQVESRPTLAVLIEKWLERMPFSSDQSSENGFNFWDEFKLSVKNLLANEERIIDRNEHLSAQEKEAQKANLESTQKTFRCLFEEKNESGEKYFKMNTKAIRHALFIFLYRDRPIFSTPYRVLSLLMDIDENFTSWRYRHALMAKRMLGTKVGTGGSSGHTYLKNAADNNRSFNDLFNLSTFLIPRSHLPKLPMSLKRKTDFSFSVGQGNKGS